MTYREYAKQAGHTDTQIENVVGSLFDPDVKLDAAVEKTEQHHKYNIGTDCFLYLNFSTCDIVVVENDGEIIEERRLEY